MDTFTRKNAWNNSGTFDNPDLLWYAKAVGVMQSRPIGDPTSWWFYAAVHGEYLLKQFAAPQLGKPDNRYLNWINIKYIPLSAQLAKTPSKKLTDLFWNQCQHATWFFPPWHRGYLVAIENILRDIIVKQLNGPVSWALPYWNYLSQSAENPEKNIPTAFTTKRLPDGAANPLYVEERYGTNIDRGNGEFEANDLCQWDTIYNEGAVKAPIGPGNQSGYFYGGGATGFLHERGSDKGDLENNPHDFVHGMIGSENNQQQSGLMGVPNTAALDPIFYLHHANIDRMWAAWNDTGKNNNSAESNWLKGPAAQGDRHFAMPIDTNGTPWFYISKDIQSTINLKFNGSVYSYTYDDISLTSFNTARPAQFVNLSERFDKLGIKHRGKDIQMPKKLNTELIGASAGPVILKGITTHANLKLNKISWKSVSKSLLETSFSTTPDEVFLELEGVKGGTDTNFLSVYVNERFVKSVSLFGLLDASMNEGSHGGDGLNFKFNITNIVDDMHVEGNIDVDSLNVQIKTKHALLNEGGITIDRIGVYRAGQ